MSSFPTKNKKSPKIGSLSHGSDDVGGSVSHFIPAFLFIADNFFQSKNTPSKFMEDIAEDNGNKLFNHATLGSEAISSTMGCFRTKVDVKPLQTA